MKTAGRSPGNRGPSSFLSRRAHLLTTRKRAVVWPSATVRSPRGIAAPAGAAGRCHSPAGAAVIVHAAGPAIGWQDATPSQPPSACAKLPLVALPQRWARPWAGARPFSFCKKKQKTACAQAERKTNGNLSSGGEDDQPGRGALRCGRFRLSELLPDAQRVRRGAA